MDLQVENVHDKKHPLTLRLLRAEDALQANSFFQQIAEETIFTLNYPGQPETNSVKLGEAWDQALEDPDKLYLGAFAGEKLVGFLRAAKTRPDHPWLKHLGYFAMMILEEYWGRGLGKAMMEALDQFARKAGIKKMEATVRTVNQRATFLYQLHGFNTEGVRKKSAYVQGRYLDEYFIAKFY